MVKNLAFLRIDRLNDCKTFYNYYRNCTLKRATNYDIIEFDEHRRLVY